MLRMAEAIRLVTDWVGDPGAVLEYSVRFSRTAVIADTDEAQDLSVSGVATEKRFDKQIVTDLKVVGPVGMSRTKRMSRLGRGR